LLASRRRQHGFTIIETVIASAILFICVTGIMTLFMVAMVRNANHGDMATRTTEYAQDKIEQLMALSYSDTTSNVAVFPTAAGGCSSGCGLTIGGALNANITYYSDYIGTDGNQSTSNNHAAYVRYWRIDDSTTDSTLPSNVKRVTVRCVALIDIGNAKGVISSMSPSTNLVSYIFNVSYTTAS